MMEERKASKGGVGDRGGGKQQVGQPMQILPEQRANQRGRQPLQRSGLPLVREKKSTGGKRNMMKKIEKTYSCDATKVCGVPKMAVLVSLSLRPRQETLGLL